MLFAPPRHASSGKSISAVNRDEAMLEGNFYAWRSRLQAQTLAPSRPQKTTPPFIDLGIVKGAATAQRLSGATLNSPVAGSGLEVRVDLGVGVSRTITRH